MGVCFGVVGGWWVVVSGWLESKNIFVGVPKTDSSTRESHAKRCIRPNSESTRTAGRDFRWLQQVRSRARSRQRDATSSKRRLSVV